MKEVEKKLATYKKSSGVALHILSIIIEAINWVYNVQKDSWRYWQIVW